MPRLCSICNHAKRQEIDTSLMRGDSQASIASDYGLSDVSVSRHFRNHLTPIQAEARRLAGVADTLESHDLPIANAKRVLGELSAMAMIDVTEYLNDDGSLRDLKTLPEPLRRALVGFKETKYGRELLNEKTRALENLAKHHGLVQPDAGVQVNITVNVSDAVVERLERLGQRIDPAIDITPTASVQDATETDAIYNDASDKAPARLETSSAREQRTSRRPSCRNHRPGQYCSLCIGLD